MTIKEAEERTGLARSNIRFYEKEGLVQPERNPQNGYREYDEGLFFSVENQEDFFYKQINFGNHMVIPVN